MKLQIILLSGPLAVGKTSVASALIESSGFAKLGSGRYLLQYAFDRALPTDRTALQNLGDRLDLETDYQWVVDNVASPAIAGNPKQSRWLVDAVRKHRQIEHFRARFIGSVHHLHLQASEDVLRQRYEQRATSGDEYATGTRYDMAVNHPNEVASRLLGSIADQVIDITAMSSEEVVAKVLGAIAG